MLSQIFQSHNIVSHERRAHLLLQLLAVWHHRQVLLYRVKLSKISTFHNSPHEKISLDALKYIESILEDPMMSSIHEITRDATRALHTRRDQDELAINRPIPQNPGSEKHLTKT